MNILLVMIGGSIGSALRYLVGMLSMRTVGTAWPWGTLAVNMVGGLVMGLFAGWLASRAQGGEQFRLFFAVGICGGFTTFSAFSLEIVLMLERGEFVSAVGYILASVILSVGALALGLLAMRTFTGVAA